jgi:hypothetical protein
MTYLTKESPSLSILIANQFFSPDAALERRTGGNAINERTHMKRKWIIVATVGMGLFLGAARTAAQSYNPIRWVKKGPTASEQLATNEQQSKKLTAQLQAIMPPRTTLKDLCSNFRELTGCVAALHVSHSLKIKFNCLKWDMTAMKPSGNVSACSAPDGGKALSLAKAIHTLKPDADAKTEAKSAEKRAHEDVKDAS